MPTGLSNMGAWSRTPATGRGSPLRANAPRPVLSRKPPAWSTNVASRAPPLDDVKAAAEVSGSQLYHYLPDKDELVQAVIDYRANTIVNNQRHADLGSVKGLQGWRNMVVATAERTKAKGGCPLGSLGGQLAESDPEARALIASGFERWSAAISDGLRNLHANGQLPSAIDPDDLAVTLLAALQGGLLLAQVQRSTRPFETTVDTLLALASGR